MPHDDVVLRPQLMYYVRVFAYLDKIDQIRDPDTGLKAYRVSVVSDDGLPDVLEFLPTRWPDDEEWRSRLGDGSVKVRIDLSLICERFDCEEEELDDGSTRYTLTLSEVTLDVPGVISVEPLAEDNGLGLAS